MSTAVTKWAPWGIIGVGIVWLGVALLTPSPALAQKDLKEYPINISCTDVNTATEFGFTANNILIQNSINSANEVYITLISSTSTTAKVPFEPGSGIAIGGAGVLRFGCITAAGETATVTGGAWR